MKTTNTTKTPAIETLTRANKLTVKTLPDGALVADFYRTHKHLTTIAAADTEWKPIDGQNKSAAREGFRAWVAENSATFGINYDPTDRRTEANMRKATYSTLDDVRDDAVAMMADDINKLVAKMPHAELVDGLPIIEVESITPKTTTSKGTDLSTLGIEDGRYVNSGRIAWMDIELTVALDINTPEGKTDTIYQLVQMELVSGQLKKPHLTQTEWNNSIAQSLREIGIVDESKPEKSAKKAKTPKAEATTPKYEVTYAVKAGQKRGHEVAETIVVEAANAKDACKKAKELVKETKGINAFRPTAKLVEG